MVRLVSDPPWWSLHEARLVMAAAKPFGVLRTGHQVLMEKQRRDIFLVVTTEDGKTPLIYLELEKFHGKYRASWQEHHVTASPKARGKGLVLELYRYLILDRGFLLVSDDIQTPGGRSIWVKLNRQPDIAIQAWDGKSLFAIDDDLDSSIEVYLDSEEEASLRRSAQRITRRLETIKQALAPEKSLTPIRRGKLAEERRTLKRRLSSIRDDLASLANRSGEVVLVAQPRNSKPLPFMSER